MVHELPARPVRRHADQPPAVRIAGHPDALLPLGGPGRHGEHVRHSPTAAIDGLIERSWGETDRTARQKTLLEAQRLMLNARPMIQLFTGTGYSTAWTRVRNRHPELIGSAAQYNYEQWIATVAHARPFSIDTLSARH